jgi:tripeptidyl-peptidase I
MFAPPPSRVEAVVNWLMEAGISSERISHSANKQVTQSFTTPALKMVT